MALKIQNRSDTAGVEMVAANEKRWCRLGLCRSWLITLVILCIWPTNVRALDLEVAKSQRIHGPVEFLRECLVTSRPNDRLLDVARRELTKEDRDTAFRALLEIFRQPHDSFSPLATNKPSTSQYQAAYELLAKADTTTQSLWVRTVEPLAAEALKTVGQGALTLQEIARRFPLTPSGTRALATSALVAHSRGQHKFAATLLMQASSVPGANLEPLRTRISRQITYGPVHRMAGRTSDVCPAALSVPWSDQLWDWQENYWEHPQMTTWGSLLKPAARRQLSWNSWQPVLRDDTIYLRTPVRVVAFNKHDGEVQWSVQTDTLKPEAGNHVLKKEPNPRAQALNDILRRDGMGTVTVSDHHVFFLDHFRVLDPRQQKFQFRNQNQFRIPPSATSADTEAQNGTRLVAIRRSPRPSVAWVIGDAPDFQYDVLPATTTAVSSPVAPPPADTDASQQPTTADGELPSNPFQGQRFCGVPVAHEQRLFVLTLDGQTFWLNCLAESTGRLNWQQPVAFQNNEGNQRGRFLTAPPENTAASLCGISGDVVICALNNGIVIGTRISDGQLLWATNLRDDVDLSTQDRLRRVLAVSLNVAPGIRSRPVLANARMYWAAPFSQNVHCLDTKTGSIAWSVPRTNGGLGRLEGSSDLYVAGATSSEILCVGSRHVRALNPETGTELWVTSISDQTGRAFCNQDSCLLSQSDGSIAQINVMTGELNTIAQVVADGNEYLGAIVADEDVVCVATPTSVSVSPTVSRWQKQSGYRQTVDKVRSELLMGGANPISMLKDISTDTELIEAADVKTLFVSSVLQLQESADVAVREQSLNLLDGLALTDKQRIRVAIASKDLSVDLSAVNLAGSTPTLELSSDWAVRADVAAWNNLSERQASKVAQLADRDTETAKLEHAILFPSHIGNTDAQIKFTQGLITDNRLAAAEMLLLSAKNTATAEDAILLDAEIDQLRQMCCEVVAKRTDSMEITSLKIDQQLSLSSDDAIAALRERIRLHVEAPEWYPHRLFLASRSLVSGSFEFGTSAHELRLPGPVESVSRPSGPNIPSIVPVVGRDAIGAISLLDSNGPQLLWWKQLNREEYDMSPIELGAFGPDFLTVTTGTDLICVHPLTGQQLWRRKHNDSAVRPGMLYRFPRITGNSSVLGTFGQRLKSYEAIRSSDGRLLDTIPIEIPDGQIPLACGQTILFHQDRVLVLHDLKTHQNLLAGQSELKVLGAGQAQLLKNQRAITITEDLNLLVMDMTTGHIQVECSLSQVLDAEKLVGLTAFERDGNLFVILKDWNGARSRRSASSRMGELKLDSGILCRVDLATGKLLWHRQIDSCVAPRIYGPKTNLLVTWTWQNPVSLLQQRLGGRSDVSSGPDSQRSMSVEVLNADTGEVVGEANYLNPAEPFRCVHNQSRKSIRLISPTSVIEMKYD